MKIDTWNCDICHKERKDEKIAVLTYPINDLPMAKRNLRYCNDNNNCKVGAVEKSKTGKI